MMAGVSKSGSPNSRCTTSIPRRSSACARSNTSTARHQTPGTQHFPEHARTVGEHADLAAGLVGPVDGDLGDPVAPLPRAHEQLDVEAEAAGLEGPEKVQRRLRAKT